MKNKETICKVKVPEIGEKYLVISVMDDYFTEITICSENVTFLKNHAGNAVLLLTDGSRFVTNVSYDEVLIKFFREDTYQGGRGM